MISPGFILSLCQIVDYFSLADGIVLQSMETSRPKLRESAAERKPAMTESIFSTPSCKGSSRKSS